MSSVLHSPGLVLAMGAALSTTFIYLAFSKRNKITELLSENHDHDPDMNPDKQLVRRSCLSSGDNKREMNKKKKKKKVRFAEDVKEPKSESYSKEYFRKVNYYDKMTTRKKQTVNGTRNCRSSYDQVERMQENRIALYSGILNDSLHGVEMECS